MDKFERYIDEMDFLESIGGSRKVYTGGMDQYIGDSEQLWENAERGYHVDSQGMRFHIEGIDAGYARNMRNWYLRLTMNDEEKERLKSSELFKMLDDIANIRTFGDIIERKGDILHLTEEINVARIKLYGNKGYYDVKLDIDEEVSVGDTILSSHRRDDKEDIDANHLRVGVILSINKTKEIIRDHGMFVDVITDSSSAFKRIKNEERIKEIEKEIKDRMKIVDKRQEIEMYAKMDEGIKGLLDELDKIEDR